MLLCAEDDDLELVSFVHEARKHGLEPEVVPGIEDTDGPLEDAMAANDAALFVVLRSDNLTGERMLALKRAFNKAKKPAQHLLALRLEPARAATAVRTIARRLQQLMAPRPSPTPTPARKTAPSPAPPVQPEVDEWAGTLIHEKSLPVERTPSPVPAAAAAKPSTPPPTPVSKPSASSRPPEHTWSGTLIADAADVAPLTDLDATPLPTSESMPSAPPTPRNAKESEAQWGGTLIADPESDFDFTLQDIPSGAPSSDSSTVSRLLERPARRSRLGLVAGLAAVVLGGLGTLYVLRKDPTPEPPPEAIADAAVGDPEPGTPKRATAPTRSPEAHPNASEERAGPPSATPPPVVSRKQAPAPSRPEPEPTAAAAADLPSLADDDLHEPTERKEAEPEPEPESEPAIEVAAAPPAPDEP